MNRPVNTLCKLALYLVLAGFSVISSPAASVAPGDTVETVRDKLGRPSGEAKHGNHTILYYDRGTVEVFEGHVVEVDLVSRAEAEEQKRKLRMAEQQRSRESAARRDALAAEGRAEKARALKDAEFKDRPPEEQVAFWQDFMRRYPDVSVTEQYTEAQQSLQAAEEERARLERESSTVEQPKPRLSKRRWRKAQRGRYDPAKPGDPKPWVPPPENVTDYPPVNLSESPRSFTPPKRLLGGDLAPQR